MFLVCSWIYFMLICGLTNIAYAKFPSMVSDKNENGKNENVNVVLFLASSSPNSNCYPEEIPHLKIPMVGKVKPCPSRPENEDMPTNFGSAVKRCRKTECDCRKLLETSIISLNSWARNALQMTTAVVSLTHDEKVNKDNNEFKYYSYKLETIDSITPKPQKAEGMEPDDVVIVSSEHSKNCNKPKGSSSSRFTKFLEKNNHQKDMFQLSKENFPIMEAFPPKPMLQYKFHKNEIPTDEIALQRIQRDLIIEPENTQVFEMDSAFNEEPSNEIVDVPNYRRSSNVDPFWDLMGIMSAMRKSFFGNYLYPSTDPQARMAEEENGANFNSLGKKQDLSLFKLVKTTLNNIKEQSQENNNNGFILVVFGGNLSDLSNTGSDFFQSLKFVMEGCRSSKTLVVVTADCPDNFTSRNDVGNGFNENGGGSDNRIGGFNGNGNGGYNGNGNGGFNTNGNGLDNDGKENGKEADNAMPLYVKGPNANIVGKAKDIPAIPMQIKAALSKKEECNKNNNNNNNNMKYRSLDMAFDMNKAAKSQDGGDVYGKYTLDREDSVSDLKNDVNDKPKVVVKRDVSKMYQSGTLKRILNKFAIYMWCILYFISFM